MLRPMFSIFLLITVFTVQGMAANVVLSNGDRVSGEITRIGSDNLFLRTEAMGEITIDKNFIDTFSTYEDIEIKTDDDVIQLGGIEEDEQGSVRLLNSEGAVMDSMLVRDIRTPAETKDPVQWEARFNSGLSGAEGNSELFNIHFGSFVKGRSGDSRFTLDGQYVFERDNGDKSRDEWYADIKYDYFLSKRVYGFSTVRTQQDDIAELDLRLSASPGVGYQWIESEKMNFSTEIGPAYLYENYSNGDGESSELTGRIAYFFDKVLLKRVSVFHNTRYFPKITDPTDLYLTTSAGLRSEITDTFFTEARVTLEHDTTPSEDAEDTDLYYTLGLGVNF